MFVAIIAFSWESMEALEVQSGKVRWHSKDREEVYRKVAEMHPDGSNSVYRHMPEDTAIVTTRPRSGRRDGRAFAGAGRIT